MESGDIVNVSPSQLATHLQEAIRQERERIPIFRKWLAHVPAMGSLVLAFWGKVYDVLDGEKGVFASIFETLSPSFIVGTIFGVIFIYGLTAFVIWLREIQKLDHRLTTAEQETRDQVRQSGEEAVDQLDADVRGLYDEFELLDGLIAR